MIVRVSLLLPLALLSLAACGGADSETTYSSPTDPTIDRTVDTDTGADSGQDTDTDTDTDTDSDSGQDTDSAAVSLYEQLGGADGVNAVLSAFLTNVGNDAQINWFFANSDLTAFQATLHDQICAATGGGCTYGGGDMASVHTGMAITDAQFDALVADLLAALDGLGVTYGNGEPIDALLTVLVGMRADIVTDADGTGVYFNQLGGRPAIESVVDAFLANVAADVRINGRFATTDLAALREKLVSQVCEATGGYCVYTGKSMLEAHAGMCITTGEFNAMAEDFLAAYDTLGVPYSSALDGSAVGDGLVQALLGMQGDIVEECTTR